MAIARIEVCWTPDPAVRRALAEGVHAALVEALRLPVGDPTVMVIDRKPEDVVKPSFASDRWTVVTVTLFTGRTFDTKRRLYRAIVDQLGGQGVSPTDVLIALEEIPVENWGLAGGVPASDIDVGFDINV